KPLEAVGIQDLQEIIDRRTPELRTLDYKLTLPGNLDEDKREFLADVSSFANTSGGDLIYGIEAKDGVPVALKGLACHEDDRERLRLESMLRDGIAPRLPPTLIQTVPGGTEGPVVILRMQRSWLSPHMVTYKNLSRFFARNSAGKYQLDVTELRTAF